LTEKPSWFLTLYNEGDYKKKAIGECSVIPGLSPDQDEKIESKLSGICDSINQGKEPDLTFQGLPAAKFAWEMARIDYTLDGQRMLFPSDFTSGQEGIPINGLIWMGEADEMRGQVHKKITQGFGCIKLKIGALEMEKELDILHEIRKDYSSAQLELRVDANGAFRYPEAREVMKRLAELEVHSIEQPVPVNHHEEMSRLCSESPLPVALDEELISHAGYENKYKLVKDLQPQYLILKPSLLGGFQESEEWIHVAEHLNVGWWITSALESNVGLNALAQWTYSLGVKMPQGLGTGALYRENIVSPLEIRNAQLFYDNNRDWDESFLQD
jgi:o-succinylbenzoate synthase